MRSAYESARQDYLALSRTYDNNKALFITHRANGIQIILFECCARLTSVQRALSRSATLSTIDANISCLSLASQIEKLLAFRTSVTAEFEAALFETAGVSITNLLTNFIDSLNEFRQTSEAYFDAIAGEEKADVEEKEEKSASTRAASPASTFYSVSSFSDDSESGDEGTLDYPSSTAMSATS